jgi:hypothetical protein
MVMRRFFKDSEIEPYIQSDLETWLIDGSTPSTPTILTQ